MIKLINIIKNIQLILSATLFSKTNELRKRMKLDLLSPMPELDIVAQNQANYMCSVDELSHSNEYNEQLAERLRDYSLLGNNMGENIARQQTEDIDSVFSVWSASETHLQNLIGSYTHSGMGRCKSASGLIYWVQIFYGGDVTTATTNDVTKPTVKTVKDIRQKVEINEPIRQVGLLPNLSSSRPVVNRDNHLMHIDIGAPYNKQEFVSLMQNLVRDTVELVIRKKDSTDLNIKESPLEENPSINSLNRNYSPKVADMSVGDLRGIMKDVIREERQASLPPAVSSAASPQPTPPPPASNKEESAGETLKLREFIEGLVSKGGLKEIEGDTSTANSSKKRDTLKPTNLLSEEETPPSRNTKRLVDFFEALGSKKREASTNKNRGGRGGRGGEAEFKEWLLRKGEAGKGEGNVEEGRRRERVTPDDVLPLLKNLFKENSPTSLIGSNNNERGYEY